VAASEWSGSINHPKDNQSADQSTDATTMYASILYAPPLPFQPPFFPFKKRTRAQHHDSRLLGRLGAQPVLAEPPVDIPLRRPPQVHPNVLHRVEPPLQKLQHVFEHQRGVRRLLGRRGGGGAQGSGSARVDVGVGGASACCG
jgi:hypothetical protein